MKKDKLENKIGKILNEEETFLLSLDLLAHMHENEKYKDLSELIFLFDNYKGFKQFIKFYEGKTITVPTVKELKQSLRLLDLFQKVIIDKRDFNTYYTKLKLKDLGLSEQYCKDEINQFKEYLLKEGNITLKQLRKLGKS